MNIQFKPVRNYTAGRFGFKPEAFVIHIAEGSLDGAYSWFNNTTSQVSSHYMVGKGGAIWQFVKLENTAWHAGGVANASWKLLKPNTNPNFYTIGIEHEGFTGEAWTPQMYEATAELIGTIAREWGMKLDRDHVIGHYQINSVSRSRCPGIGVDLNKLVNLALKYYEDPKMIKELQDKILQLQSQLSTLQSQVSSSNIQITSLQSQLSSVKSQNSNLQNQISTQQSANSNLQSLVSKLESENSVLKSKITELTNRPSTIPADIIAENQKLKSQVKSLEKDNLVLLDEAKYVKEVETKNSTLTQEVKKLQLSQSNLNARIIDLEKQILKLKDR